METLYHDELHVKPKVKDKQHSCSTLELKDEQSGRCSRSTLEVKEDRRSQFA